MGKGGGGGTAAGAMAGNFSQMLGKMSGPARRLYFGQMKDALTKGTITNRIPIIQQLVESGLSEGSRAMDMTNAQIAQAGGAAGRSSNAQETIAAQKAMTERAVAGIPSEVISNAASSAIPDTMGAMGASNALLGTAGVAQAASQQAKAAQQAQTTAAVGAGVGAAIAIVAAI